MGAGLGALRGARPRRWGPIEIIWTVILVVALAAGAVFSAGVGDGVAQTNRDYVPQNEIGRPDSWRPVELGGFRTELPGIGEKPDAYSLQFVMLPSDARHIDDFDGNIVTMASVNAPPPPDGATAFDYVKQVGRLWGNGSTTSTPPREGTMPGAKYYEGAYIYDTPGMPQHEVWRVIVAGNRTFVIVVYGEDGVMRWYPRIVEHLELPS
jgi:hypothetical protein